MMVGPTEPRAIRTPPASSTARHAPALEITIALRTPTLAYPCQPPNTGTDTASISSPGSKRGALRTGHELAERHRARAGCRDEVHDGVERSEHRQAVASRRARRHVAAERRRVADLWRTDGARGLAERRHPIAGTARPSNSA